MSISRNGPIALQYPGSHAQFIQWERRRGELSLFRFARSPAAAGRRGDQNVKRRLRFEQLLQRRLIQHLHPPSASTTTATAATTQRGARTSFAAVAIPVTPSVVIAAALGSREMATTSQPSSRSMMAAARPMPLVPPKTSAFLPLTSMMVAGVRHNEDEVKPWL